MRGPSLLEAGIRPYRRAIRRGLVGELITLCLVFAVFFPLTLYFDNRLLSTIPHPTSPFFGAMMSILALVGLAALIPLRSLMLHRGFDTRPVASTGAVDANLAAVRTPTMSNSWRLVLLVVAIMFVSLGLSVSTFG